MSATKKPTPREARLIAKMGLLSPEERAYFVLGDRATIHLHQAPQEERERFMRGWLQSQPTPGRAPACAPDRGVAGRGGTDGAPSCVDPGHRSELHPYCTPGAR